MRIHLVLTAILLLPHGIAIAAPPLLDDLTTQGVKLGSGVDTVLLPRPTMSDGLDAAAQEAVIRKTAGRHPLDRFLRKSVVAPIVIARKSINDSRGARLGHRLDVFFVVHGRLSTIADEQLLNELNVAPASKTGLPSENRLLSKEELSGKDLPSGPKYSYFGATVIDKVYVTGVSRAVETRGEGSVLVAVKIDPQFNGDAKFPNQWSSIVRKASGVYEVGPARPYCAFGACAKATELVDASGDPTGAIFVECHVVFGEPEGWFDGRNLLAPKLPLVVQEEVRRFRRKLDQFEQGSN